jgi:hypothetical protein
MATACLKAWKMHKHVVYKSNKYLVVFICKNENYSYKKFHHLIMTHFAKIGYTVKSLLNKSLGDWFFLHKIKISINGNHEKFLQRTIPLRIEL